MYYLKALLLDPSFLSALLKVKCFQVETEELMCRSPTRTCFLPSSSPSVCFHFNKHSFSCNFLSQEEIAGGNHLSIFLALISVKTCTNVAMPICVDLISSFQLKAKCNRSLLGNPRRSAGMRGNECQGCLFPNSWRVSVLQGLTLQPVPRNRRKNRATEREGEMAF